MINVHGINTDSMDMIITEILDYADMAMEKLYDIETLVSNSESYFKGDAQKVLRKKFNDISVSFPAVKNNIISYAEELNRLKSAYIEQNETINLIVKKSSDDINMTKL